MFESTTSILQFYTQILDIARNNIPKKDIRLGMLDMAQAYAPESTDFESDISDHNSIDFSIPAYRCAYLHKYAALHTYIVFDAMKDILKEHASLFKSMLKSKRFKLCCLGGGPGSDAVGVLAALCMMFTSFESSVTIIDSIKEWKSTFNLIIHHLRSTEYDTQRKSFLDNCDFNYIGADLLQYQNTTETVSNTINSASLITMVKFISAASCANTEPMVEKIFRMMNPGALVLFIDNAAGGFTEVIERAGKKYNFHIKSRSHLRHKLYSNTDLKVKRFGHPSCFQTRVTILLMQKPCNYENKKRSRSRSSLDRSNCSRKVLLREVQNVNEMRSQIHVATQDKINKALLYAEAQCPLQANCSNQSISFSKRKPYLPPNVQNIEKSSLKAKENLKKPLLRNETQYSSQFSYSSQSTYASEKNASLSSDIQNIKNVAKGKINESSMPNESRRLLQPYRFSQSIYAPERNTILSSDMQNVKNVASGKINKSLVPNETQRPSHPNYFSQSFFASKRNTFLSQDMQNVENAASGKIKSLVSDETQRTSHPNYFSQLCVPERNRFLSSDMQSITNGKINKSLIPNETQHHSQPKCFSESILASKTKPSLSGDVQIIKKAHSQESKNANKSLPNNEIHHTLQSNCSAQNTLDSKKKDPLPVNGQNIRKIFSKAREDVNKSLKRDNSITSTSVANDDLIPPHSNTSTAKINNLIHHQERFYPQTVSSSLSPGSDISSRSFITPSLDQVSYSEGTENLESSCCSCCVVS